MRHERLTDAALDRELARTMAVEPSSTFAARIRMRVATERMSGTWSAWPIGMTVMAGAAVAAALTLFVASPWRARPVAPTVPPIAARAVPSASGSMVASSPRTLVVRPPARGITRGTHLTTASDDVDVVIDPREARAMRRFLVRAARGRLDLAPLLGAAAPPVMDFGPLRPIDITPLQVSPLTEQGAQR